MDIKNELKEMQALEETEKNLKDQADECRSEIFKIRNNISVYLAEKHLNLKIGDVVQYTKKTWKKSEDVKIKITGFSAHIRSDSDYEDTHPVIIGVRIKKDGTQGEREERIYAHEKIEWKKIS